jgi:DNA-binding winged helix-turn-helix (wHTH) protein
MAEKILYEFDGFRLDPSVGTLDHNGNVVPLRAKPFELLRILLESHGQSVSKDQLVSRVWPGSIVTDGNFHVQLDAVRKALGETGREPRFIFRTATGYKFVANVREVPVGVSDENREPPRKTSGLRKIHIVSHLFVACAIYAALYSEAVFLEVAYDFDRYRHVTVGISLLVFGWIMIISLFALTADRKLTLQDRKGGLLTSILIFLVSAIGAFVIVIYLLPNSQVTQATFQTYPAQAAYLKDIVYFLALALLFLILPFHFVTRMEAEVRKGLHGAVLETLTTSKLAVLPRGTIYPQFWALSLLLLFFAGMAIAMTTHLVDGLLSARYRNLFIQLVYLRGILYFGLGIECLVWYRNALNEIKSLCLPVISN